MSEPTKAMQKALLVQAQTGSELEGSMGLSMRGIRLAVRDGNPRETADLLARLPERAWRRPLGAEPVVHLAAKGGSLECLEMLLSHGAPVGLDLQGKSALMVAAGFGSLACVKRLARLCDPALTDQHGFDALIHAAKGGHASCVLELLPLSDAARVDARGEGAMHWCAREMPWSLLEEVLPALAMRMVECGLSPDEVARAGFAGANNRSAFAKGFDNPRERETKAIRVRDMLSSLMERGALEGSALEAPSRSALPRL